MSEEITVETNVAEARVVLEHDEYLDMIIETNWLKIQIENLQEELKQSLKRKEQTQIDEENNCVWVVKKAKIEETFFIM